MVAPPKPCKEWWDYLSGGESLTSRESLYHAVCDEGSTVKSIYVTSDHKMILEVERSKKRVTFEFDVFLSGEDMKDVVLLGEIMRCVKKKNLQMGLVLAGIWVKYLEHEKELEELCRI